MPDLTGDPLRGFTNAVPAYATETLATAENMNGPLQVLLDDAADLDSRVTNNVAAIDAVEAALAGTASTHNHDDRYPRYDAVQVLASPDAARARGNIGAAATSHTHAFADITGLDTERLQISANDVSQPTLIPGEVRDLTSFTLMLSATQSLVLSRFSKYAVDAAGAPFALTVRLLDNTIPGAPVGTPYENVGSPYGDGGNLHVFYTAPSSGYYRVVVGIKNADAGGASRAPLGPVGIWLEVIKQ